MAPRWLRRIRSFILVVLTRRTLIAWAAMSLLARLLRGSLVGRRLGRLRRRTVDRTGAFEVAAGAALVVATDERLEARRQRRHFVRIQSPHEARRDEHHQLRLLGTV